MGLWVIIRLRAAFLFGYNSGSILAIFRILDKKNFPTIILTLYDAIPTIIISRSERFSSAFLVELRSVTEILLCIKRLTVAQLIGLII
jgi:hypothetical protein